LSSTAAVVARQEVRMVWKNRWAALISGAALGIALATLVPSCRDSGDACEGCALGNDVWYCYVGPSPSQLCAADEVQAQAFCDASGGELGERITCADGLADTTDGDPGTWHPQDFVYYSSGSYHIDGAFVAELKAHPDRLLYDGAYIEENPTGGYFKFKNVQSTDLAYALGMRTNDQLTRMNGMLLRNWGQCIAAFDSLYNATTFSLEFKRGTSTLTYYYVID
jgi:hypothetical protein